MAEQEKCPVCGKGFIRVITIPGVNLQCYDHQLDIYRGKDVTFHEYSGCQVPLSEVVPHDSQ